MFVDTMANRDHSKSRSPVNAKGGTLAACHRQAQSQHFHNRMRSCSHPHARGDFHSEWLPDSQQPSGTSSQVFGISVSQSPFAHLGGPTYRGDPPTAAPAPVSVPSPTIHLVNTDPFARARMPQSSRAWLLQLCLTRDRHHLCLPSFRSVMVTTGAANAHEKASPPFLVSCATLRISTRAPPWMRLRALCSPRLSGSRARLPLVVASGEWELGFAIGVVRPHWPSLLGWATSSWAPSARLSAVKTRLWSTPKLPPHPASPLTSLPLTFLAISRSASARFLQTPSCTFLPAAACA